ncbi:hypothetical protein [Taibaiella soli]|uniref:Cytochrome c domain-containing protein n=1 Tax=Taibaiella soli TaxID=1649169 RepID=A0A2W2AHC9_9BACT|nr:hypothetical protein [Taibaiella soli]PZF71630.1 hypothetical protein DN068_16285 [Taibaiella soli]
MKRIPGVVGILLLFTACNSGTDRQEQLQTRIDSLQQQLDNSYKPGLGEFMSGIQVHHAKLWFAGTNNNWKLADFEINEIEESLEAAQKYCADRPEVKSIQMISPAMDSVKNAVGQQNALLFKSSYILLTNTCNNCHRATQHEFNVITIPSAPPFTNQSFQSAR